MNNLHFFGVRHLSPSAAYHLLDFLEKHKPKCILIEGPADATPLMSQIAQKGVKPPIAMLGYTTELPIETVLYPFASYSPEYQAICWGVKKKATLRFIDLPTENMLKLLQEQPSDEEGEKEAKVKISSHYNFSDLIALLYKLNIILLISKYSSFLVHS